MQKVELPGLTQQFKYLQVKAYFSSSFNVVVSKYCLNMQAPYLPGALQSVVNHLLRSPRQGYALKNKRAQRLGLYSKNDRKYRQDYTDKNDRVHRGSDTNPEA